jgi:3'-phosphoadenosine 5'-phosphosulfate sulfotransferase (PAPS reductase)/FAD synthetase
MKRIFNFSGGKTSAYMVIHYYQPGDLVIFCDTGREHQKTYKFINDFEAYENIPIIRIKYQETDDPYKSFLEKTNYDFLPDPFVRTCTKELKVKTCRRYLRSIGIMKYENFIGFRYDEPLRVKRRKQMWKQVFDKFPLYDDQIDKPKINAYWESKPYNLEIPSILGNCTLCFMKGKNAIINILSQYPELAKPWIEDEEKCKQIGNGHTYFNNITYKQMLSIAQNNLFSNNLDEISPAYNCSCTS